MPALFPAVRFGVENSPFLLPPLFVSGAWRIFSFLTLWVPSFFHHGGEYFRGGRGFKQNVFLPSPPLLKSICCGPGKDSPPFFSFFLHASGIGKRDRHHSSDKSITLSTDRLEVDGPLFFPLKASFEEVLSSSFPPRTEFAGLVRRRRLKYEGSHGFPFHLLPIISTFSFFSLFPLLYWRMGSEVNSPPPLFGRKSGRLL